MDIIQGLIETGSTSGRLGLRIVNNNKTFDVINNKTSNVILSILNDGKVSAGSTIYSNLITNYVDTASGASGTTSNVVSSGISSQWTTVSGVAGSGSKIYYNNGNVGIGTIDPIAPLHIYNNTTTATLPTEILVAGATSATILGTTDRYISFPYSGSATTKDYTFTTTEALECDILIVGGGGGGGYGNGGGGGAGQLVLIHQATLNGTYTIKVGNGGLGGNSPTKGTNSEFGTVIAEGGGANGGILKDGGSGAGGDGYSPDGGTTGAGNKNTTIDTFPGATVYSRGNNGGNNGGNGGWSGGGGGGAGAVGTTGQDISPFGKGGDGLSGISSINYDFKTNFGTNIGKIESDGLVWFAAGGGGGGSFAGNGGLGGGGAGTVNGPGNTPITGVAGLNGTGSGGGGGSGYLGLGGSGGSGIVIIRYRRQTQPSVSNSRLLLDATTTGTAAIDFRRGVGADMQNDFRIINDSTPTSGVLKLLCENSTQAFGDATANITWFSSNETILYKNTTMNGRVGIGTTYHASRSLDVLGDVNISGIMSVGSLSVSGGSATITNSLSSNVSLVIQNNTPAVLITPTTDYTTSITTEGTQSIIYQTNTFTFNQGNVIAYYNFNSNYNDNNPSSTKYNLTPTGAPELISTATNFIEGSSAFLNANGEFLATAVNFPNTFGTSYSFWFKRVNNSTHDLLFAIGTDFFLVAHTNNTLYFSNTVGGNETYGQSSITWVNNIWYHCVFIFLTDGTWKIYINGNELIFSTLGGNYPFTVGNGKMPTGKLYIGGKNVGYWTAENLDGYIDEFYVFNKVLTSVEIINLYNKTYSLPNNTWNINFPISTAVIINNGSSHNVAGNYTVSVSNNSSVIPAGGQSTTPYPSTAITSVAIKYANVLSSSINFVRGTAADANHDYKIGNYKGDFKVISSVSGVDTDYIKITTTGAITNPTGTASWNTGSDRRIKENIERASYDRCYENINSLELNRFNYISGFNTVNKDKTQLGFIAQEVYEIFPKAISSQEYYSNFLNIPDLLSVDVSQINYSLYGAVKKLIKINEGDESYLETFEKRLKTIETTLNIISESSTSNIVY